MVWLALPAKLAPRLPANADITAQVHDAVTIECDVADADGVASLCREAFEAPQDFTCSGSRLTAVFPIDLKVDERWS